MGSSGKKIVKMTLWQSTLNDGIANWYKSKGSMFQLCQRRTASIVRWLSPRSYSVTVILTFLFAPDILSKSHPVVIVQPFTGIYLLSHPIHPLCDGLCGKFSKSNHRITWVLTIKITDPTVLSLGLYKGNKWKFSLCRQI